MRKNFQKYSTASSDKLKADAKRIMSSIFETMSIEELDKLYTPNGTNSTEEPNEKPHEEVGKDKPNLKVSVGNSLPFSRNISSQELEPVPSNIATLGKLPFEDEDTVVVNINKPVNVVFRKNPNANSVDTITPSTSTSSPSELAESEEVVEYNPLLSAPALDLSSDKYLDVVKNRSQGMAGQIQVLPGFASSDSVRAVPNQLKSIEDDPNGLSVTGLDNNIGLNML